MSPTVSPRRRRYRHAIPWAMQLCITIKSRKRSNVFLCVAASARYRGSGEPASRRGSPVSCKAAFLRDRQCRHVVTLILAEPLRLRHLPYPRHRAAEEDIATHPNRALTNFTARLPIFTAPASTLFFQSMLRLFNWISNCLIFCCNCSTLGNSRSISANCTLS